jgi:RNA polymerase sigma factor (sigma-70 family)
MIFLAIINAIADPVTFLTNSYQKVEAIIRAVCFRNRLKPEDTEDFASEVKLRLVENDYRILRVFTGKSSIETYLTTVIANTVRDLIRERDGRWRPSEEAKRLGEIAERIEELVYRFRYPFHEAYQILTTNFGFKQSEREVREIFFKLKPREERSIRVSCEEEIHDVRGTPEMQMVAAEQNLLENKIACIIDEMREQLSATDRMMLRMAFEDNLKLTVIAEQLRLTRAEVDRRIREVLIGFKRGILQQGINYNDVRELIGDMG